MATPARSRGGSESSSGSGRPGRCFAVNRDLAVQFTTNLARGYKEQGMHGIASACWALSQEDTAQPDIAIAAARVGGFAHAASMMRE
jgi:hypothetical protein